MLLSILVSLDTIAQQLAFLVLFCSVGSLLGCVGFVVGSALHSLTHNLANNARQRLTNQLYQINSIIRLLWKA